MYCHGGPARFVNRGDTIVCCFRTGPQGNLVSRAPDGRLCILDRSQRVPERAPFVCTVKAAPASPRGGCYVVLAGRPLCGDDYDRVVGADAAAARLVLGLRHPTWFQSLREHAFDAEREQRLAEGGLRVVLRRGTHVHAQTLPLEAALRAGLGLPALVGPPPAAPAPAGQGIVAPAGWTPGFDELALHHLLPTKGLIPLAAAGDARHAARRLLEAVLLQCLPPARILTPQDAQREAAAVCIARLATAGDAEARRRLARAEGQALLRHLQALAPQQVEDLCRRLGIPVQGGSTPLSAYLALQRGRSDGEWALVNQDLRAGRVHLDPDRLRALLADHAARRIQDEGPVALGAVEAPVAACREIVQEAMAALGHDSPDGPTDLLRIGTHPPCIAAALDAARHGQASEAQARLAIAYMRRLGAPERAVRETLGHAWHLDRFDTPAATGNRRSLRVLPCAAQRALGACHWACPGAVDPVRRHQQLLGAAA